MYKGRLETDSILLRGPVREAVVGKYIDFRNMHRMSNIKFVNFFILLAAVIWSNLYDT
jgi:hypothetical protein